MLVSLPHPFLFLLLPSRNGHAHRITPGFSRRLVAISTSDILIGCLRHGFLVSRSILLSIQSLGLVVLQSAPDSLAVIHYVAVSGFLEIVSSCLESALPFILVVILELSLDLSSRAHFWPEVLLPKTLVLSNNYNIRVLQSSLLPDIVERVQSIVVDGKLKRLGNSIFDDRVPLPVDDHEESMVHQRLHDEDEKCTF